MWRQVTEEEREKERKREKGKICRLGMKEKEKHIAWKKDTERDSKRILRKR